MTTVTYPSAVDVVSTYTYDDADRLTGIEHVQGRTTMLASVDYTPTTSAPHPAGRRRRDPQLHLR